MYKKEDFQEMLEDTLGIAHEDSDGLFEVATEEEMMEYESLLNGHREDDELLKFITEFLDRPHIDEYLSSYEKSKDIIATHDSNSKDMVGIGKAISEGIKEGLCDT